MTTTAFPRGRRSLAATLGVGLALAILGGPASASPEIGKPAPEFTGAATDGRSIKLSELRGKTVVLEWTNDGCPYVHKHYGTRNMQKLQKEAAAKDVAWLTIISSAPGLQGHVTPEKADELTNARDAAPAAVILDPDGKIGRAYEATATPHMFVIDPEGVLQYKGAIDDKPTSDHDDVKTAKNYVTMALAAVAEGKTPDPRVTRAYGCSVKYAR